MIKVRTSKSPHSLPKQKNLILVGGGHAHVQLLRRFAMKPEPNVRIIVVVNRTDAVYSGMVPGYVAGDYKLEELQIDVIPLARRAGASVILAAAVSLDPDQKRIVLCNRPSISYDIVSIDVGSTVKDIDAPGVWKYALATRPISSFVDKLNERIESLPVNSKISIVGGGAAGVELCLTIKDRVRRNGKEAEIQVLSAEQNILSGYSKTVKKKIHELLIENDITVKTSEHATAVEKDFVITRDGKIQSNLTIWATGAAPTAFIRATELPKTSSGFLRITSTLQVENHPDIFAVGDCSSLVNFPWVPKAGVYAVRQGPYLERNLRRYFSGRRLIEYKPQRDFLSLLHLGNNRALGTKWGKVFIGNHIFRIKRWIDRRFMSRFQVLDSKGKETGALPSPSQMGMDEMECGGCAAKLGGNELAHALSRLPKPISDEGVVMGVGDDAALVATGNDHEVLLTVDAFRAFQEDSWLVGRVAAVNAVSDIYACGGTPRYALAWIQIPDKNNLQAEETLWQTLSGIRNALDPLSVSLVGGHTTRGDDLNVGLAVTGTPHGSGVFKKGGAQPGDKIILTKALGTGVILAADMRGLALGQWIKEATESMVRPNAEASDILRRFGASAVTDVTGFGLAVHLGEMLLASQAGGAVYKQNLPLLSGAQSLILDGVRSTFHSQNHARAASQLRMLGGDLPPILFDPQTSGGLLAALPQERASSCLAALKESGDRNSTIIGEVVKTPQKGALLYLT